MNQYLFVVTGRNRQVLQQFIVKADNREIAWKLVWCMIPSRFLNETKCIELNQVVTKGDEYETNT
jgi:hypothetical protein